MAKKNVKALQVAFIGSDFWAAENRFMELKREAHARKLDFKASTLPRPKLMLATKTISFFGGNSWEDEQRNVVHDFQEHMAGARFDVIFTAKQMAPEVEARLRPFVADSGGPIQVGTVSLD